MDTVTVLLMGFISIMIVNNLVFSKFLGICPYLGVSGRIDMAFGMGCAVTFVITLSGTLTWLIDYCVLQHIGLEVMRYVCFILVIAGHLGAPVIGPIDRCGYRFAGPWVLQ